MLLEVGRGFERAGLAGGLNGPEREQCQNKEKDGGVGVTTGDELLTDAEEEYEEVAEPDDSCHAEFKAWDSVGIFEPEEGTEDEGGGEANGSGDEESGSNGVELLNGGEEGVDALMPFVFKAILLEEEHGGNEGEDGKDAVTEDGECGVEFDPRFTSEASGGIGVIPRWKECGGEAESSSKGGGEKPEEPEAAGRAYDEVEECRGPGDELADLVGVAEGTTTDDSTAEVEG